jgi:ubiquinone/menaquinone biosynthesis C-methylase UbiE
MVRFGKMEKYHPRFVEKGPLAKLYVQVFGCVSITAYNFLFFFKRDIKRLQFQKVLDAGCGKGDFTFYLAEKFPNVPIAAWDLSDPTMHDLGENISICKEIQKKEKINNINFYEKDLKELSETEKYDFIFCIHVLEHIPDNKIVLNNFFRALKEGGYLHLQMPSKNGMVPLFPKKYFRSYYEWEEIEHVGEHYYLEELVEILQETGFTVESSRTDGGFLQSVAWQVSEILITNNRIYLAALLMPFLKLLVYIGNLFFDNGKGSLVILAKKARNG